MISRLSLLQLLDLKIIRRFLIYAVLRYFARRKIPWTAILELTFTCPCSCDCCSSSLFQEQYKNSQMPLEVARTRLSEIIALGIPMVHLSGGEPLCYANLLEVVDICKRHNLLTFLETSAFLMTLSRVQQLKAAGLSCVNISIDSADPEIHDSLRNVLGSFEKAIQSLKWCVSEKLPCMISTYATHQNIENGDLVSMISLAKDIGCQGIRIIGSQPSGRWLGVQDVVLTAGELVRLKKLEQDHFLVLNMTDLGRCPLSQGCKVVIFPDGAVGPCEHLPFIFKDSLSLSIKDIVEKMASLRMFKSAHDCLAQNVQFMAQEGRCSSGKYLKEVSLHD